MPPPPVPAKSVVYTVVGDTAAAAGATDDAAIVEMLNQAWLKHEACTAAEKQLFSAAPQALFSGHVPLAAAAARTSEARLHDTETSLHSSFSLSVSEPYQSHDSQPNFAGCCHVRLRLERLSALHWARDIGVGRKCFCRCLVFRF